MKTARGVETRQTSPRPCGSGSTLLIPVGLLRLEPAAARCYRGLIASRSRTGRSAEAHLRCPARRIVRTAISESEQDPTLLTHSCRVDDQWPACRLGAPR